MFAKILDGQLFSSIIKSSLIHQACSKLYGENISLRTGSSREKWRRRISWEPARSLEEYRPLVYFGRTLQHSMRTAETLSRHSFSTAPHVWFKGIYILCWPYRILLTVRCLLWKQTNLWAFIVQQALFMYQSIRNFNIHPPGDSPAHLTL